MLTDAVRASGWVTGLNALEGSENVDSEPSNNDDGDAEERFESALRSVTELFTAQVSLCLHYFRDGEFPKRLAYVSAEGYPV